MAGLWRSIATQLGSFIGPWGAFQQAALFFFQDLFSSLRRGDFWALTRLSAIADGSFGRFYSTYGHHFAANEETLPLPGLVHSAHDTVLELGACTGNQLPRLDTSKVTHVYGIEPNTAFVPALTRRVEDHGLGALYTPVWARFEDAGPELERLGVRRGEVDCVLSVQVLCSVDDPAEVVRDCWRWLKPGGELIYFEHGANKNRVTRFLQRLWNIVSPPVMGGCQLTRPMMECLMAAEWEIVETGTNEEWQMMFPRMWGRLKKPMKPSKVY